MHNAPVNKNIGLKTGRLKKRPEFLCVASKGKKWVSDTVIVQVMETEEGAPTRFGYTATKKIGNAVTRNRAKRRLRAAVDEITKTNQLKSCDIVLIARDTTVTCDWGELTRNLTWCFRRLDLLKGSS